MTRRREHWVSTLAKLTMIYRKVALSSIWFQCFSPLALNGHIWMRLDCSLPNRQDTGAETFKRREQVISPMSWNKLVEEPGLSWVSIDLIVFVSVCCRAHQRLKWLALLANRTNWFIFHCSFRAQFRGLFNTFPVAWKQSMFWAVAHSVRFHTPKKRSTYW